jgi:hypothetical protein
MHIRKTVISLFNNYSYTVAMTGKSLIVDRINYPRQDWLITNTVLVLKLNEVK